VLDCCHDFPAKVEGQRAVVSLERLLQVVQVLDVRVDPVIKPAGFSSAKSITVPLLCYTATTNKARDKPRLKPPTTSTLLFTAAPPAQKGITSNIV
jgi:hypothetical protein